ncbi:MAG: 16S rRNA (uracil(1498)-N(3))-methyltransferase [Prevotella sp.]|nr:16S rRNA (uracil(1498)-N(3))-methyltransferase [Prevotella sp.]
MKEERYFYVPQASMCRELPEEEAAHAVRVLRLKEGDEMVLMDGEGVFYHAEVSLVSGRRCLYNITETMAQQRPWPGRIHLAIAPTKMMERMEWLAEKATEVGFDELSLLSCRFSERKVVKVPRLEKIVVSAMKQSRKAWLPVVNEMESFGSFIKAHTSGRRFIAHCYGEVPRENLFTLLSSQGNDSKEDSTDIGETLVLVGPEGDFSIEEVRQAVEAGFVSVDLGPSRLRTETAGLAAVMMMQLALQNHN